MEPFIAYLLKSSGLVLLFLLCYAVLLQKETAFKANRIFLVFGLLISIILPLVTFTKIVWIEPSTFLQPSIASLPISTQAIQEPFNWKGFLLLVYGTGTCILLIRFVFQLLSLKNLLKEGNILKIGPYNMVETHKNVAPFSFFNYIVYHRPAYSKEELSNILTHEKIHVQGNHSLDIIFMNLVSIFLWFNPFIWLYKSYMEQNLEFIADHETAQISQNIKSYQYLLLKTSMGSHQFSMVNPFFNSLIKKRIVMLNKSKSNKKQVWKYALIIPMLITFFFMFNIKTIAQYRIEENIELLQDEIVYTITKDHGEEALNDLKREIKSETGATLKLNGIKRNNAQEITAITVEYQDKERGMVRARYDEKNGIDPINFGTNSGGGLFITSGDNPLHQGMLGMHRRVEHIQKEIEQAKKGMAQQHDFPNKHKNVVILQDDGEETIMVNGKKVSREEFEAMEEEDIDKDIIIKKIQKGENEENIWIESSGHDTQKIIIKEVDGKKTIEINGRKISPEQYERMEINKEKDHMRMQMDHSNRNKKEKSVFILKDGNEEMTEEHREESMHSSLIELMENQEVTIMIDGKESTKEQMQKLNPEEIATVDVHKEETKGDLDKKKAIIKIVTKKKD